jgi:hypothetical protein
MPHARPRPTEAFGLGDCRVDDRRGQRVGTLAAVYAEPGAPVPAWFLVRLGRYSTRFVLAPPADVLSWRGRFSLPWDRLLIERAPLLYAPPAEVTPEMETELRRHYRLAAISDVIMRARRTVA